MGFKSADPPCLSVVERDVQYLPAAFSTYYRKAFHTRMLFLEKNKTFYIDQLKSVFRSTSAKTPFQKRRNLTRSVFLLGKTPASLPLSLQLKFSSHMHQLLRLVDPEN